MRAVICDDDASLRRVARAILEGCDVEVVGEAENTVEALTLVRTEEPDMLLLDVALPVITGIEALPVIVERAPFCAVILFTAFDLPREEAIDAGAYDVLYKPGGLGELESMVLGLQAERARRSQPA